MNTWSNIFTVQVRGTHMAYTTSARVLSVVLFLSLAVGSGLASPVKAADPVPLWTVMVYLDSDNNLEPAGIDDFLEMSSVGSTSSVNILVQMDRWDGSPPPVDNTDYGNWQNTTRFYVTAGMTPDDDNAVMYLGEVDMADPATLTDFIDWGVANYPAENYALVLWDHGAGWMGLLVDDDPGTSMDMGELATALSDASADNGGLKLDLLGFDACLMAGIEVAAQVSDYAGIMVASEVTIPWNGWNYALLLDALVGTPEMTPAEFAEEIVHGYVASYSTPLTGYSLMDITLSSTDLSLSPAVETAVDALAVELLDDLAAYVNYISLARASTEAYDDGSSAFADLFDFAHELDSVLPDAEGLALTSEIMSTVDAAVLYEDHWNMTGGLSTVDAHGLTFYFPSRSTDYSASYGDLTYLAFAQGTQWDEFLEAYYLQLAAGNSAPTIDGISPLADPVVVSDVTTFQADATDPDGNLLTYSWSVEGEVLASSDSNAFDLDPAGLESGTHVLEVEVWDGEYSDTASWNIMVNEPPTADAGDYFPVIPDVPVALDGSGSSDDWGIDNYTWSLEDDGSLEVLYGVEPIYTFTVPGIYEVNLTVTDIHGLTDTDTSLLYVVDPSDEDPVADAGEDQTVLTGMTVAFDGVGSTDDLGVTNYTWTFVYNGTTTTLYGAAPEFTFWTDGVYAVTLNVTDMAGQWDTDTVLVTAESVAIPEFGTLMLPVLALLGAFLLIRMRSRGRAEG